jgi:hypothetical protein
MAKILNSAFAGLKMAQPLKITSAFRFSALALTVPGLRFHKYRNPSGVCGSAPFSSSLTAQFRIIFTALAAVCATLFSEISHAQGAAPNDFILTASSGVYQSSDGRTKIILAYKDGAQGFFVVHFNEGIIPQEFNPETTPAKDATSVFIRFDPTAERQYSELVVGQHVYKVLGSLNIWLTPNGSVSVNIDNMNPYLTVTTRSQNGKNDSLVGFYGMTEVVKGVGNLATILTANQLSPEIAKLLIPYIVTKQELTLNSKEVKNKTVGLFVRQNHPCNGENNNAILKLEQLQAIQKAKTEVLQAQLLERFLRDNKAKPPMLGHLILRAEPTGPMILLNIASKNISDVRVIKNTLSHRTICVVSPIS